MTEEHLDGGITNAGKVVRVDTHVLRPSGPHTEAVHAYLTAVRRSGFQGAPLPIGIDPDGRERLEFIDGDVPTAPYPGWSQRDEALTSIARLLRQLHDATAGFDPSGLTWNQGLADPAGGSLVCHNDLELSNIVFRNGVAVGFIDFEFAAPGRPVYDLAHFARLCVPIEDDVDQRRMSWNPANRQARLRLVADAYGLDRDGRSELLHAMDDALDTIEAFAHRSSKEHNEEGSAALANLGGIEKYERRRRWWAKHRDRFATALI